MIVISYIVSKQLQKSLEVPDSVVAIIVTGGLHSSNRLLRVEQETDFIRIGMSILRVI